MNRGGRSDLPLLWTLLTIHQKSWEPSFWEVINSFDLLAYASLAASRTLTKWLLACLNFTLDLKYFSVGTNEKNDFYNLWQQHKQLKTMDIWVTLDLILTMRDIYINSNLNPLTKFTSRYPPMEQLSNDHEDWSDQTDMIKRSLPLWIW